MNFSNKLAFLGPKFGMSTILSLGILITSPIVLYPLFSSMFTKYADSSCSNLYMLYFLLILILKCYPESNPSLPLNSSVCINFSYSSDPLHIILINL